MVDGDDIGSSLVHRCVYPDYAIIVLTRRPISLVVPTLFDVAFLQSLDVELSSKWNLQKYRRLPEANSPILCMIFENHEEKKKKKYCLH